MNTKLAQNEEFTVEQADGKKIHIPAITTESETLSPKSYVDEKTTVGIGGMWKALRPTTYNVEGVDYPIEVQITS